MENKRIISDPTPENSPEVLTYGKDNLKKVFKRDEKLGGSDEYNLIPRSYADALEVFPVIREHWKNNAGSRIFPLSDELSDEAYKFFFKKGLLKIAQNCFACFMMLWFFPIIVGFSTYKALEFFNVQNSGIFVTVASVIVFSTSLAILSSVDFDLPDPPLEGYKAKEKIFDMERMGHIPAIQWRKAMDVQFLDYEFGEPIYGSAFTESDEAGKNKETLRQHFEIFKRLVSEFFVEENLASLEKIDSNELAKAYNDYMEMMIFVLSNKESLSDEMTKKYAENLDLRCDVFIRRTSEAIDAMKMVSYCTVNLQ